MALEKRDFYGKEVAEAIKSACDTLGVPQEKLEIEVLETGSTGIFGLIRKKAHIRVAVRTDVEEVVEDVFEVSAFRQPPEPEAAEAEEEQVKPAPVAREQERTPTPPAQKKKKVIEEPAETAETADDDDEDEALPDTDQGGEASAESLEIVKAELLQLVELMGFPSTLEIEAAGLSVTCTLRGEFEENLTGADGKVLDSLQYLLRKMISRKVPERLRISINVGDFREKRLDELKVRAVELATLVKEDGKTQILPALNPSERRVIHMILQEDKEIRSRSVGDGLFKKILIYKPGKSTRSNGRKRPQSKGPKNKSSQKKGSDS
jgi:spoIIIJ-associated protein